MKGRCHCGNVRIDLQTRLAPGEMPIRRCGCSFCRLHGARSFTDPAGRVTFTFASDGDVERYRFGTRGADFLICRRCGVYVGAVLQAPDGWRATLSANVLEVAAELGPGEPVDYLEESPEDRRARRLRAWMPAALVSEGAPAGPRHFLLIYDVVPDYAERRLPFRGAHLDHAWEAERRGELVLAGALADPVDGAVLLFRGTSPAVAEAFAEADPYVRNGIVTRWRVRPWTTVVGRDAATPIVPALRPSQSTG